MENPEWQSTNALQRIGCSAARSLPFSLHNLVKKSVFDTEKVIAVSTESVVAHGDGYDEVDKFMFKYPGKMSLDKFRDSVSAEVSAVTETLAGIALPTTVSIKLAQIFKNPNTQVLAVAQTQQYIDTDLNPAIDIPALLEVGKSPLYDRTTRDLDSLIICIDLLSEKYNYFPDIAQSAGNLRQNTLDGSVTLIDVMPAYMDGRRLIGDAPVGLITGFEEQLQNIQEFVGQYGS
jgi:hypothetical protein